MTRLHHDCDVKTAQYYIARKGDIITFGDWDNAQDCAMFHVSVDGTKYIDGYRVFVTRGEHTFPTILSGTFQIAPVNSAAGAGEDAQPTLKSGSLNIALCDIPNREALVALYGSYAVQSTVQVVVHIPIKEGGQPRPTKFPSTAPIIGAEKVETPKALTEDFIKSSKWRK